MPKPLHFELVRHEIERSLRLAFPAARLEFFDGGRQSAYARICLAPDDPSCRTLEIKLGWLRTTADRAPRARSEEGRVWVAPPEFIAARDARIAARRAAKVEDVEGVVVEAAPAEPVVTPPSSKATPPRIIRKRTT